MVQVSLLGVAQDGGRPQVGCFQSCCRSLQESDRRYPVSIGIIGNDGSRHLIEASRHLGEQLAMWRGTWCEVCGMDAKLQEPIQSLFITHAHSGHIDGLSLFGRETMSARGLKLYVSHSLHTLIEATPHWNLMLKQEVFKPHIISSGDMIAPPSPSTVGCGFYVEPLLVPHRAELSDMHAFIIRGPSKSLLFLPDHDTWEETLSAHGVQTIREFLCKFRIDIALLDATFYSRDELGVRASGQDQAEVPHPPVIEQLEALGRRLNSDPEIVFIHMNHTNPLYNQQSQEWQKLRNLGYRVGEQMDKYDL